MDHSLAIFAALIAIPINTYAQGGPPISQVEVVNLPAVQDVNVTNPTSCDEPVVIAGATTAIFTGKIGGLGGLWTAHEFRWRSDAANRVASYKAPWPSSFWVGFSLRRP